MAFVKKIEQDDGIIGIWEITEEVKSLTNEFLFSDKEKKEFEKITADRRKKEFLVVRLLLQELLNKKTEIFYSGSGRPKLKNFDLNLSISHSRDVAVIFLSKQKIGIDVENEERKIGNVAQRFLHESEKEFILSCKNQQKTTILFWCAKEAIFKCSEEQGIEFSKEILISPFFVENESNFEGKKIQFNKNTFYRLQHFNYKNNVIVFCVEEVEKS